MTIRKTTRADVDRVMEIYDAARRTMRENNNPTQWVGGYPSRELVEADIDAGTGYVMEDGGRVFAAFAFIIGEDPTYSFIEGGSWLNGDPYGTIHRIGSDGSRHGALSGCVEFCSRLIPNLRIDTHRDNAIMRRLIAKEGFTECGIIYIDDGTPRIAFQKLF